MILGVYLTVLLGACLEISAKPSVYLLYGNEAENVKRAASFIMMAYALKVCLRLFNAVIFALLRSGGDTKFLFFLDSGITYIVGIPFAFILVLVFKLDVVWTVLFVQVEQLVRIIIAYRRFKAGYWMSTITGDIKEA